MGPLIKRPSTSSESDIRGIKVTLKDTFENSRHNRYMKLHREEVRTALEDKLKWPALIDFFKKIKEFRVLKLVDEPSPKTVEDMMQILENYNRANYEFSKIPKEERRRRKKYGRWSVKKCNYKMARIIVQFSTDYAVPIPSVLNKHYKPHSAETYGETNLNQMKKICDQLKIGVDDVFVDLGSGIGQLVAFVAAFSRCKKSVGIEMSPLPSEFAVEVGLSCQYLMKFFGKTSGYYELHRGDFFKKEFRDLIVKEATVIFINNFAFDEGLMNRLKRELLEYLSTGVRIVTTKSLSDKRSGITEKTSDRDTGFDEMSDTVELMSTTNSVSWAYKEVKFYCTTMNLEKFTNQQFAEGGRSPSGSDSSTENHGVYRERRLRGRNSKQEDFDFEFDDEISSRKRSKRAY